MGPLAQAELAYNHMKNRTIGKSSFKIVYTKLPRLTVDLTNIPSNVDLSSEAENMVERIAKLHKDMTNRIEKMNEEIKKQADKHRGFKEFKGALVMIYLRKTRLPTGKCSKEDRTLSNNKEVQRQCIKD